MAEGLSPDSGDAQLRLACSLERQGRWRQARRCYRLALAQGAAPAQVRIGLALACERSGHAAEARRHLLLAASGQYPPSRCFEVAEALERAGLYDEAVEVFRKGVAAQGEKVWVDWPERFAALVCARRYPDAFRLAERMVRLPFQLPDLTCFIWPWRRLVSDRRPAAKRAFCVGELARVRRASRRGGHRRWFALCRALLLDQLGRKEQAWAEYPAVSRPPERIYGWMRLPFVMILRDRGEARRALALGRGLLKRMPRYWWLRCRLAEIHLAAGGVAPGLREFERALRLCPAPARPEVLAWHGEALLWIGRYREALARLDAAVRLGGRGFVFCWRGAARLKLGDRRGAMADLDRAVESDPDDVEALVWRGEACRLAGRPRQALRDLDRAVRLEGSFDWAYCNRALVKGSLGDERGMAEDFGRIRTGLVEHVRGRLGLGRSRGLGLDGMRAVLEEALRLARGVRRPEAYAQAVWSRRGRLAA